MLYFSEMTDVIRAHLLGSLMLSCGGAEDDELSETTLPLPGSTAARSLLAYLLFYRDHPHPRSVLAGQWWPDLPESRARRALSQALWHIRRILPDLLQADGDTLYIPPDAQVWVDVAEFQSLLEAHLPFSFPERSEIIADDPDFVRFQAALTGLNRAVQLYRGDLLEGLYDDWVLLERERLHEMYLQALEALSHLESAMGHHASALESALALTRADPLREAGHRQVMRLYARLGRPEAALQQFAICREILKAELGLEPTPETKALAQRIIGRHVQELGPSEERFPPARGPMALDRTSPHLIPLIGRERERAELLRHIERMLQGQGGVVLIEGEAGVGKTRLLKEVAQDARRRGVEVLWGQCREQGTMRPYGPLLEALDMGLSTGYAGQLTGVVEEIWLRVLRPLLPPLAAVLPGGDASIAIDPGHERLRVVEAFAHLLSGWAGIVPLVLVIEDLHWANEDLLDLLIALARRLDRYRVLLIGTYRGEELSAGSTTEVKLRMLWEVPWGNKQVLGRLDREMTGELVRHSLGLLDPAPLFESRIYRETGGNPLFVLETLRALYEEGQIYQDEHGGWHTPWDEMTHDYVELRLPPGVGRVIARRLAKLEPEERTTLNAAAVLERDFTFALLHRTSRLPQNVTLRALHRLVGRQLLVEDRATYHFSHDKIREVVYRALGTSGRQDLHYRAAMALEALHPDQVELLAHHFEHGQVADKAAYYHYLAGRRAAARHAHTTAVSYYDRAVALAEKAGLPPDFRFDVRAARERALEVLGRREEQAVDLEVMVELAQEDPGCLMEVCCRRAWLLAHMSHYDEAEAVAGRAFDLARRQGDKAAQAAALTALGAAINWRGEPTRAVPHLRTAVELSQQADDLQQETEAREALANALVGVKAFAEARAEAEAALTLRETLDDRPGQAETLGTLGIICMEQGATGDAVACYRRALELCRAIGYRYGEARNLSNLGSVLYFQGQIRQAMDCYHQAVDIFQDIGHDRGASLARINLASVLHTIIGDDEAAWQQAEAALAYCRTVGDRGVEGQCLVVLGEIAFRRGDSKAARGYVDDGLAALAATGERWLEVQARRVSASLWLAEGQHDEALRELEVAEELCQSLGMPKLAVGLLPVRSQVLLALGQPASALATISQAISQLTPGVERPYLIYFCHAQALLAAGREDEACAALDQAYRALQAVVAGLSPEQQAMSLKQVPEHRAIVQAWEATQPRRIVVRLPRADAPTGRPLHDDEYVEVAWTIAAPEDEAIRKRVDRRRHRLLRLLEEAHAQGAVPAYTHLAEALGVGLRTIERDMTALRQTHPNLPPTRGARVHGSTGAGENSSQPPSSPAH